MKIQEILVSQRKCSYNACLLRAMYGFIVSNSVFVMER